MSKERSSDPVLMAGHGRMMAGLAKPKEKAGDIRGTMGRLAAYLGRHKSRLLLVILMVIITTGLNILGPYLMKVAIDSHIKASGVDFPALARLLGLMAAAYVGASLFTLFQQWIMVGISQEIIRELRDDVFAKFQQLTIRFFDSRNIGELMSRVTNDIDNINNTLSDGILQIISAALSLVSVATVMLIINWQLSLICLSVIPLVILIVRHLSRFTRRGFRDRQKYLAALNGTIEETITGHELVKAFTREDELAAGFAATNRDMRRAAHVANSVSGFMGPLMNMMNNLNYAVTAFAGGLLAIGGHVTVGVIAAFLNYTRQYARPINQLAQIYTSIQSAIAGAERVFAILDEEVEFKDSPRALTMQTLRGAVKIRDLEFRYQNDVPVLRGISINAEPGQTIAIVGPTGAGKTTIINLLTRFYDFHSGTISIDDVDIRDIARSSLRSSLGIVLQDSFLFSDSIMENIRYGRLDANDDEVIAASKTANAHQFIHRMPDAYNSHINENGGSLSLGQRQLIAIARTILSDPAILILDEATSSVDTRTELHIQEAMLRLMEGRTSFVIAHRLSTIKNADTILVMNDGQIIEQGKHRELLDRGGFYTELYMSQFALNKSS